MSHSLHSVAASAPGKIILAGEHAVVHGTRALATVIDLRTTATVAEMPASHTTVTVRFHTQRSIHTFIYPLDDLRAAATAYVSQHTTATTASKQAMPSPASLDSLHAALSAVTPNHSVQREEDAASNLSSATLPFDSSCLVFLIMFACLYQSRHPVVCDITSQLPMSAGLGSSASYCSALAAAFWSLSRLSQSESEPTKTDITATAANLPIDSEVVNAWSYEGERVLHGTPSGVDNSAIVHGGCLLYRRGQPFTFLPSLPPLSWLIVNTRQPRDTKQLVAGVGQRMRDDPATFRPMIDRIDAIVGEWQQLVQHAVDSTDLASLPALMHENQTLLDALGVSHPTIDSVLSVAERHGLAGKLTGAGGGGCVLLLAKEKSDWSELEKELAGLGFQVFRGHIGGSGVDVQVLPAVGTSRQPVS